MVLEAMVAISEKSMNSSRPAGLSNTSVLITELRFASVASSDPKAAVQAIGPPPRLPGAQAVRFVIAPFPYSASVPELQGQAAPGLMGGLAMTKSGSDVR